MHFSHEGWIGLCPVWANFESGRVVFLAKYKLELWLEMMIECQTLVHFVCEMFGRDEDAQITGWFRELVDPISIEKKNGRD